MCDGMWIRIKSILDTAVLDPNKNWITNDMIGLTRKNLPLLLCLEVSEPRQPAGYRVKTIPDVLIADVRINLNHMVDLLNLQRLHLTMFRLQPKCRHLNLTPAMHVTEITTTTKCHKEIVKPFEFLRYI